MLCSDDACVDSVREYLRRSAAVCPRAPPFEAALMKADLIELQFLVVRCLCVFVLVFVFTFVFVFVFLFELVFLPKVRLPNGCFQDVVPMGCGSSGLGPETKL